MQPLLWHPPVGLSEQEEQIVKRIRRAKIFVFLRHHRHELLDEAFQQELAGLYRASKRGQPPIAPTQLALAIIVQAYTGVSDDEVIEATLMDRRWQLVLDCLDTDQAAAFSKGTFVAFRKRLIDAQMDRRLIERTIELHERQQTVQGRAQLRERVAVEHTLAHVGRWQGRRARYRGLRKNLFDLRRCAVVHNLHVLARSQALSAELQATA
jgi:hypothetical protein